MSSNVLTPINPTPTPVLSNVPGSTNPDIQVTGAPPAATTPATSTPTLKMVPMLAPDGSEGSIPSNRVNDAVRAGGKLAVNFVAPDGTKGLIPIDRVHDAIAAGGHIDDPTINALSDNSGLTGLTSGFAKGAVDTMRGVANLAGGEGTAEQLGIPNVSTAPSGIAEHIGKGGESVLEFMLGNEALQGLSLSEKLTKIAPTIRALEAHPALARIVGRALSGGTVGGAQGALKGAASGNAVSGAEIGAALGTVGGAATEIGSSLLGAKGVPADTVPTQEDFNSASKPNIFKQIIQGEKVAQPAVQQAIRRGVQTATENAGTADESVAANIENQPLLNRNQTIVDEHLSALRGLEQDAYERMDEAAGFDVKAEKAQLANDQYKLKQLGNTDADAAMKDKLTASIEDSQARIADAEAKMQDAGVDPTEADAIHKQRMAGADFRKALIQSTSSDGQTVNVDGLLNASKKLQFTKYGDRLQQFFGSKEAADDFMSNLEQAQKLGNGAVKARQVARWLGTIAGLYEGGKILHGLLAE